MAIAVASRATPNTDPSAATGSTTPTFASNTAGNTLVAIQMRTSANLRSLSCTDTAANSWKQLIATIDAASSMTVIIYIAYNCNASAGSNVVTMNDANNVSVGMAYEISGLALNNSFDLFQKGTTSAATTPTSGTAPISTYSPNELLLAGSLDNGSTLGTYTAGTGYSNIVVPTAASGLISAFEEQIISTRSFQSATFNLSASAGQELTWMLALSDTPIVARAKWNTGLRPHAFSPGLAR